MSYADQLAKIQEKRAELRALEAAAEREAKRMQPLTEADERAMLGMQARADSAYQVASRRAPPPLPMERPDAYRRRLASGIQNLSPRWREARLEAVGADALDVIECQIYQDALKNGRTAGLRPGEIRQRESRSAAGHVTFEFDGNDAHFTQQFGRAPRLSLFKTQNEYQAMTRDAQLAKLSSQIVHAYRPPLSAPRSAF